MLKTTTAILTHLLDTLALMKGVWRSFQQVLVNSI